jgi:hypothetical protein
LRAFSPPLSFYRAVLAFACAQLLNACYTGSRSGASVFGCFFEPERPLSAPWFGDFLFCLPTRCTAGEGDCATSKTLRERKADARGDPPSLFKEGGQGGVERAPSHIEWWGTQPVPPHPKGWGTRRSPGLRPPPCRRGAKAFIPPILHPAWPTSGHGTRCDPPLCLKRGGRGELKEDRPTIDGGAPASLFPPLYTWRGGKGVRAMRGPAFSPSQFLFALPLCPFAPLALFSPQNSPSGL